MYFNSALGESFVYNKVNTTVFIIFPILLTNFKHNEIYEYNWYNTRFFCTCLLLYIRTIIVDYWWFLIIIIRSIHFFIIIKLYFSYLIIINFLYLIVT